GTVADARGTALASDQNSFLGITIVPEKEMIWMISEKDKTKVIEEAVTSLECLQEKGMGVMFAQHVEKFVQLGK
ncbi:MAG TPA: transcriptional regulator, partial [Spirochaetaceae bacterium]|nr:transcriptional regulator [Spirochaetaceae bacterium]